MTRVPGLLPVPADFRADVERAQAGGAVGDLELLRDEVQGFPWESEGMRLIDRARRALETREGARSTPEAGRDRRPNVFEDVRVGERTPGPARVLLFTGHMIDAPGRITPRFPVDKAERARTAIREAVVAERAEGIAFGLAGGACGGDILFHEVCAELGIASRLYLAVPPAVYVTTSVAHGGPDWESRFWDLCARLPPRLLVDSEERARLVHDPNPERQKELLPRWLRDRPDYGIWQRAALWLLHHALAAGPANVTLIALWDGEPTGDGAGGTADLVTRARARGARVVHLNTRALFGL
jgi:hypothetical protein